jgi:hypothetical protein
MMNRIEEDFGLKTGLATLPELPTKSESYLRILKHTYFSSFSVIKCAIKSVNRIDGKTFVDKLNRRAKTDDTPRRFNGLRELAMLLVPYNSKYR